MDQNKIWESFGIKTDKQNPRALAVNTVLAGKYLVGPMLGEGGFGITYAGYDLNMETRIAIKEYFPVELVTRDTTRQSAGDSGAVSGSGASVNGISASDKLASGSETSAGGVSSSGGGSDRVISLSGEKSKTYQQGLKKYVDEARNVSQFADIPGIVSVKDFFYENNTAYIVMEYIEGISLKEYLKQKGGKLSEEESLAILRPVLEALEKVHAAGIVHRDISPDNIMLTFAEEGKTGAGQQGVSAVYGNISAVKLIDFGAARMTSKNDQKSLTIILKHGYAPEEQYRSHGEQGPWTDVYALCAVLYRMLTGKVPEPAMDRLFSDELKRPEEVGAKVSSAVSEAILRGLAVKKEKRIQSVRELMDALYAGKKLRKSRGRRTGGKSGKKAAGYVAVAAAAAVCVLAVTGIGWKMLSGRAVADGSEAMDMLGTVGQAVGGEAASAMEKADFSETVVAEEKSDLPETVSGGVDAAEGMEEVVIHGSEEELGEQIAFYRPQDSMSTWSHTLICKSDGTVEARVDNGDGQCEVQGWTNIVSVKAGNGHSLGLRSDGTVVAAGDNYYGQCDVTHWKDVVQICAGENESYGVTKDGEVLIAGTTYKGEEILREIGSWSGIKSIAVGHGNYGVAGLTYDGTVLFAGMDEKIEGWDGVEEIFFRGPLLVGLEADGTVRTADGEASGQAENMENIKQVGDFSRLDRSPAQIMGAALDGSVAGAAEIENADARKELLSWSGMRAADCIDETFYIGLKDDDTILEYYANLGNASPEDFQNLEWAQPVGLSYSSAMGILAQTKDGRNLYFGNQPSLLNGMEKLGTQKIKSAFTFLNGLVFLTEGGTLVSDTGWEPETMSGVEQIVQVQEDLAVLLEDGSVRLYEQVEADVPDFLPEEKEYVESWKDIVQICGGTDWICGLKKDGTVFFSNGTETEENDIQAVCGNDADCLGIRSDGTIAVLQWALRDESGNRLVDGWTDMTQLAMGNGHTVGLRSDGTVVAAGNNHCGQCDVEEWKDVVYIDAKGQCTIGITRDGRLLFAGSLY